MRRVSPIPPVSELLHSRPLGDFHLVLAHLMNIPGYAAYYKARGAAGDYLVLDNGAHENGAGLEVSQLMKTAHLLDASEVVMPDALFSAEDTVRRTRTAFMQLKEAPLLARAINGPVTALMVVPQGRNFDEWKFCLDELLSLFKTFQRSYTDRSSWDPILVVGVSKDYDDIFPRGLVDALEYLEQYKDDLEVHCLGWPRNLWKFTETLEQFPRVRSTDSARAYVYAINGVRLDFGKPFPEYPKRPADYFTRSLTSTQRQLAEHNLQQYYMAVR